jgi:hypothetical protein
VVGDIWKDLRTKRTPFLRVKEENEQYVVFDRVSHGVWKRWASASLAPLKVSLKDLHDNTKYRILELNKTPSE